MLSIDDCADVVVGGAEPGATNVFGESLGHGIAPHNARSLRIEGNIIGTSWNGKQRLGNLAQASIGTGITLRESRDVLIRNNVVEGWKKGGVYVGRDSRDVRLEHNVVRGNNRTGVVVHGAAQVVVTSNVVESNGSGILMILSTSVRVAGNTIQRNMGPGIETLLSTQTAVRANVVQGNGS